MIAIQLDNTRHKKSDTTFLDLVVVEEVKGSLDTRLKGTK